MTAISQASILKGNKLKEYLSNAFKKHDDKVQKDDRKAIAKQFRDDGFAIEILEKKFNLTKEEIEAL